MAQRASRTAEYMALFRAVETAQPASKRFFDDPVAHRFLSGGLRAGALLARAPGMVNVVERIIDWRAPGPRGSAILRTRVIDDAVREAIGAGASQLVILGAGFDSRAYRMKELANVRVFEVDHPAVASAPRAARWPASESGTLCHGHGRHVAYLHPLDAVHNHFFLSRHLLPLEHL